MDEHLKQLIAVERAKGDARGVMVRCPVCGIGRGRPCRDETGRIVIHEARVALFRAEAADR